MSANGLVPWNQRSTATVVDQVALALFIHNHAGVGEEWALSGIQELIHRDLSVKQLDFLATAMLREVQNERWSSVDTAILAFLYAMDVHSSDRVRARHLMSDRQRRRSPVCAAVERGHITQADVDALLRIAPVEGVGEQIRKWCDLIQREMRKKR
ncbi:MAG: hypothetical protein KIS87_04430 [Phycisphaeraceae bacterium]|nr:hypothetical protein [Phycisphaeraceae bacterium]